MEQREVSIVYGHVWNSAVHMEANLGICFLEVIPW